MWKQLMSIWKREEVNGISVEEEMWTRENNMAKWIYLIS